MIASTKGHTTNGTMAERLPELLPHHLKQLRDSGLSDETIREAKIRTETDRGKLALLLRAKNYAKNLGSAIVFPFYDRAGTCIMHRLRPDFPRKDGAKYLQAAGSGVGVYFPPAALSAIETHGAPLYLTEGEKKALAATQHGFPTIGLTGVDCWHAKRQIRLVPDLESIDWKERVVFIVFDSDAATNEQIQANETGLAQQLQLQGAVVRVVRLPPGPPEADGKLSKQGFDDYLVAHGADSFRLLLGDAKEPEKLDGDELKSPASQMEPAEEVRRYLETGRLDGVYRLRFWKGAFHLHQGGRYVELKNSEVRAHVVNHLNARYSYLSTTALGNAMMQLSAQSLLSGTVEQPAWVGDSPPDWPAHEMLAARNGLVHLPSLVAGQPHFMARTPRYFSPTVLDYDFQPDAPKPEAWFEFLRSVWANDQDCIDLLQEWFGLCLTLDTSFQKILMVIGPKRSGKGTIGRVLQGLVGKANCAGPTLASMATNFGLWPLLGKSVAIISDARLSSKTDQAIVVERLLSISGEDSLTIDRKMLEQITTKLLARLTIISNELPKLGDASGAVSSRMLLLPLSTSFYGREDRGLTARLLAELPSILRWSVAGWKRLTDRGHFTQPEAGRELMEELENLTSPTKAFIADRCKLGAAEFVAVCDLYAEWKDWTESRGWKDPGREQDFGKSLRAALPEITTRQVRDGATRDRTYFGIGIKP